MTSPVSAAFREQMRADPDYCDARIAGWWCWGLCCWIGGGWCTSHDEAPDGDRTGGQPAKPPCDWEQMPRDRGRGVHVAAGLSSQRPHLFYAGIGVHGAAGFSPKIPHLFRGRGVNGNDAAITCADRLAWLVEWFGRLRDRLRSVRVCCGDWSQICSSDTTTVRLGRTGLFLGPPYSTEAGRNMDLYAVESGTVAHDMRRYCLERGDDPRFRICLAGYVGEGHEELTAAGWEEVAWKTRGGYANRGKKGGGNPNAAKERLWFSPHSLRPVATGDLFAEAP